MSEHLLTHGTRATPQSQPLDADQVANSAGGYSYEADIWTRLRRFLILGTEGGSYYARERELTLENVQIVRECLQTDGPRTVNEIVKISDEGRAPSNEQALWALAAAISHSDKKTRRAAAEALPKVARIGTHLYHFVAYFETMRGWGPSARWAVSNWYDSKGAYELSLQAIKYRQRDGWSHRDLLRLAHPKTKHMAHDKQRLLGWIAGKESIYYTEGDLRLIGAFELAQQSPSPEETAQLVEKYQLPREALLTDHLTSPVVWEAMLFHGGKHGMPITALIRNLANMTRIGLLSPGSDATKKVVEMLRAERLLQHARVHPISMLIAQRTYASGRGMRGSNTWNPVLEITDALDDGFYLAFQNVETSGKSHLLALDVSASMAWPATVGGCLTPREASAAMALVTLHAEPNVEIVGFSHELVPLNLSRKQRLNDAVKAIDGLPFGGTDCSLPMLYAAKNNRDVDAFVVYTDSETWAGRIHPKQALDQYRQHGKPQARSVVVGMTANRFTIADPKDTGMLDVVGFDTAAPGLIADFAAGRI